MSSSNRLPGLREAQGISRQQLADDYGVVERTVRRWETGASPIPQKHWERLAEQFGVKVSYLLGLEGDGDNGQESRAA